MGGRWIRERLTHRQTTKSENNSVTSQNMNPKHRRERCQDFIDYLDQHPNQIFRIGDPGTWLPNAVKASGGQGNEPGEVITINPQADTYLKLYILAGISRLAMKITVSQSYFDAVFFELAHDIERAVHQHSPETSFTFGRAQKIVTVYFKILYALFWGEYCVTVKIDETLTWLGRWSGCLHIPVDRQTLQFFQKRRPYHSYTNIEGNIYSWKKTLGKVQYCGIQEQARRLAAEYGFLDPVHLEMTEIWTQPRKEKAGDGCGAPVDPKHIIAGPGSVKTPSKNPDESENLVHHAGIPVLFLDEGKSHPLPYLKLLGQCAAKRNDGLIGRGNCCINLKLHNQAPRYLIGLILAGGGNFLALPNYVNSSNQSSYGHGGTGYEGYVPFPTLREAVHYLKQYFLVKACPWNSTINQSWIDVC